MARMELLSSMLSKALQSRDVIDIDNYDNEGFNSIENGNHVNIDDQSIKSMGEKEKPGLAEIIDKPRETPDHLQFQVSSTSTLTFDPLKRTGRIFGSLIQDIKFRYPLYWTDIKDGLNLQCLSTTFFLYFAILAPSITFGGILGDKTNGWLGPTEMLLGSSIIGVGFSLVGGQPLLIIAGNGLTLVFEDSLYKVCKAAELDFLAFRFWVAVWAGIVVVIVVAAEATFLVRYFTRFTKDMFALLISLVFITETFLKVKKQFDLHPLQPRYDTTLTNTVTSQNMTTEAAHIMIPNTAIWNNHTMLSITSNYEDDKEKKTDQPNTALLSFILTFSTFIIAYFLRMFKNSSFFGRRTRRLLGDFGVTIAITIMVVVDVLIKDTYTEKLDVPDGVVPTSSEKRGWIISPLGQGQRLPIWAIFAAIAPGLLFFILLFMDVLITSMIINRNERSLKKGPGYNIDLLFVCMCTIVSGIFGFPFISPATIRSMAHTQSLEVYKKGSDGKQHLFDVKEQRLTSFVSHILLGVSSLLGSLLHQIPLSVLVGIFLYMGVCALNGIQMFIRVGLFFKPRKHHPDVGFVNNVGMWKMHLFTFIQVFCLGCLWAVMSTIAALSFPLVLIVIALFRFHILKHIFTEKELYELDNDSQAPPPEELPDNDPGRNNTKYEDVYERSQASP